MPWKLLCSHPLLLVSKNSLSLHMPRWGKPIAMPKRLNSCQIYLFNASTLVYGSEVLKWWNEGGRREKQAVALKQNLLLIGRATLVSCRTKRQKALATKAKLDFQISTVHEGLCALLLKNNNLDKNPSWKKPIWSYTWRYSPSWVQTSPLRPLSSLGSLSDISADLELLSSVWGKIKIDFFQQFWVQASFKIFSVLGKIIKAQCIVK